jgi:hypothetical protein
LGNDIFHLDELKLRQTAFGRKFEVEARCLGAFRGKDEQEPGSVKKDFVTKSQPKKYQNIAEIKTPGVLLPEWMQNVAVFGMKMSMKLAVL